MNAIDNPPIDDYPGMISPSYINHKNDLVYIISNEIYLITYDSPYMY